MVLSTRERLLSKESWMAIQECLQRLTMQIIRSLQIFTALQHLLDWAQRFANQDTEKHGISNYTLSNINAHEELETLVLRFKNGTVIELSPSKEWSQYQLNVFKWKAEEPS